MKRWKRSLRLGAVSAVSAVLLMAAAGAGTASAGTLLKSQYCHMSQVSPYTSCFLTFEATATYTCYAKITANYSAPYASHQLYMGGGGNFAGGFLFTTGYVQTPWSTAVSDRTPLTTCTPGQTSHWAIGAQQAGGGSPSRPYTISLFSGTY